MNQEDNKEKLVKDYLALDQVGAVVDRVLRYYKFLSIKAEDSLELEEKIWLLAYKGLETEFKPGTEESLVKAATSSAVLESVIPEDYK